MPEGLAVGGSQEATALLQNDKKPHENNRFNNDKTSLLYDRNHNSNHNHNHSNNKLNHTYGSIANSHNKQNDTNTTNNSTKASNNSDNTSIATSATSSNAATVRHTIMSVLESSHSKSESNQNAATITPYFDSYQTTTATSSNNNKNNTFFSVNQHNNETITNFNFTRDNPTPTSRKQAIRINTNITNNTSNNSSKQTMDAKKARISVYNITRYTPSETGRNERDESEDIHIKYAQRSHHLNEVQRGNATIISSTFNIVKNIVGIGVLTIPWAVATVGIIPAIILTSFSCVASYACAIVLAWSAEALNVYTYRELAHYTFGKNFARFMDLILFLFLFCVCILYVVFLGDFLDVGLQLFGITLNKDKELFFNPNSFYDVWHSKYCLQTVLVFFVLYPLTLLPKINSLTFSSILGLMAMLFTLALFGYDFFGYVCFFFVFVHMLFLLSLFFLGLVSVCKLYF